MKRLSGLRRGLGMLAMSLALMGVSGGSMVQAAPSASETTSQAAIVAKPASSELEQRYAEREKADEALQNFEGGQGGTGIYIGASTLIVVLLVVLILVIL